MSKELIADVFNRSAAMYDQVGVRFFSYFGELLVEKLNVSKGAKLLDIGCGRGAVMIPAAKAVGENGFVEGIDISLGMLEELNKVLDEKSITNTRTLLMDADDLGFPDESFEYIAGSFVLFFFPDPLSTLTNIKPLLKVNGKLCFTTFSKESNLEWVRELILKYLPELKNSSQSNERFETRESLLEIFTKADYKNVDVLEDSKTFVYENEDLWFEELWSHGFRRALESMTDENLQLFKSEAFKALQSFRKADGFHIPISILFTIAEK